MKWMYIVSLILVALCCTVTSQGGEDAAPTGVSDTTIAPTNQATPTPTQPTPTPAPADAEKGDATTKAPTTDAPTTTTSTTDSGSSEEEKDKSVLGQVSKNCTMTATSCAVSNAFLKEDNIKDMKCDDLKKAKSCLTTEKDGAKCSDKDYKMLEDSTCFCPRIVASLSLVAMLCFLSKLLGQH